MCRPSNIDVKLGCYSYLLKILILTIAVYMRITRRGFALQCFHYYRVCIASIEVMQEACPITRKPETAMFGGNKSMSKYLYNHGGRDEGSLAGQTYLLRIYYVGRRARKGKIRLVYLAYFP